jgi:sulfur-oxidizing protein SoxY
MVIKNLLLITILISISIIAKADANPDLWPYLHARIFKDHPITEVDFLKISGPKRASSGAQVPINIQLTSNRDVYIKKITLIIDANPGQHAATFHLSNQTQDLNLFTRIRMEMDSFVRVIAEDNKHNLYMSKIAIRASGGCSGYMNSQDPELTKDLGKILIKYKDQFITTRIKHPNFTGLQKDSINGWFVPKWIVEKIQYKFKDKIILIAENKISISQDPYLRFNFSPSSTGDLVVSAIDNTGLKFNKTIKIL